MVDQAVSIEPKMSKYFEQLLAHLGVDNPEISVSVFDDRVEVQLTVSPEESGILIGHHGESLFSIQKLAATSLQEYLEEKRLTVNVNNYQQVRDTQLVQMAGQAAEKAIQTGLPQALPYLPAHERLKVHTALANNSHVRTQSEGEGSSRRLFVYPVN